MSVNNQRQRDHRVTNLEMELQAYDHPAPELQETANRHDAMPPSFADRTSVEPRELQILATLTSRFSEYYIRAASFRAWLRSVGATRSCPKHRLPVSLADASLPSELHLADRIFFQTEPGLWETRAIKIPGMRHDSPIIIRKCNDHRRGENGAVPTPIISRVAASRTRLGRHGAPPHQPSSSLDPGRLGDWMQWCLLSAFSARRLKNKADCISTIGKYSATARIQRAYIVGPPPQTSHCVNRWQDPERRLAVAMKKSLKCFQSTRLPQQENSSGYPQSSLARGSFVVFVDCNVSDEAVVWNQGTPLLILSNFRVDVV
ncbi:hypothetical protein ACRALDRAFT_209636 [Sodiomyces alcalophilus JCM 7366]|uniref:uncharacterized protein n=1 Tax=Sodiomyces alcalophilus JCM 7366 TaxID=591952 RepID=UPI0039B5E6EE